MQVMTYDEMRQLNGGDVACTVAVVGLAAAEMGLVIGFATGFHLLPGSLRDANALFVISCAFPEHLKWSLSLRISILF